jgi:alanyl aminopeptidase
MALFPSRRGIGAAALSLLLLLQGALGDDANRVPALDFLRAHFDALVAKLPQDSPGQLIVPLRNLCTPGAREAFFDLYRDRAARFQGGARRYAEALESIDLCLAATSRAASR